MLSVVHIKSGTAAAAQPQRQRQKIFVLSTDYFHVVSHSQWHFRIPVAERRDEKKSWRLSILSQMNFIKLLCFSMQFLRCCAAPFNHNIATRRDVCSIRWKKMKSFSFRNVKLFLRKLSLTHIAHTLETDSIHRELFTSITASSSASLATVTFPVLLYVFLPSFQLDIHQTYIQHPPHGE